MNLTSSVGLEDDRVASRVVSHHHSSNRGEKCWVTYKNHTTIENNGQAQK
jgi:hypothetical protein